MAYTLDAFAADCRAALKKDPGPAGREAVRKLVEKASLDADFLAAHVRPDQEKERNLLYEDPELGFCILGHVYNGAKGSPPHDHGPSWAIYGQTYGVTEMTDWRIVEKAVDGQPGKAAKTREYKLEPGMAHVYNEGDLHSPSRRSATRLIRIEGINLLGMKRDRYDAVEG